MKTHIKVFKFLLSFEEHSVYYSNEKTASVRLLLLDNWALQVRPYKCQNGHSIYKMCRERIVKNKFLKLTADTSSEIVQEYIDELRAHDLFTLTTDLQPVIY